MNFVESLKLYAITDSRWHPELSMGEMVTQAIQGGVSMIQLREKDLAEEDFYNEAKEIQEICKKNNVVFIINDNVEMAAKIGADGVHIGQSDMSLTKARQILGEDKIIGVTARTVEQAQIAEKNGADYLGCGAIFGTFTKGDAKKMEIETLQAITNAVSIPVVAIGGIQKDNVCELSNTNINGIAVVSGIFGAKDIRKAAEELLLEYNKISMK